MYTNTKLVKGALRFLQQKLATGNGSLLVLGTPAISLASELVGEEGSEDTQLLLRGVLDPHVVDCIGILLVATDPTERPSFHCGIAPDDGHGDYFGIRRSFADAMASATQEGSLLSTNPPFVAPDCFTFALDGGILSFDEPGDSPEDLEAMVRDDVGCRDEAWRVFSGITFKEVSDLVASAGEVARFHEELELLADQP